eukprot:m.543382 g.543382  ORF g.543382 m.543382 type:complete len:760 (-) comp22127_c0_seq1:216-2495(-)
MDEIKRLQDEFAKAQMSGSMAKLSERNCIQIIQKLQELNMIDLLYTMDGKTYLTHDQLEREIKDELYVHGSRINIVELHEIVNVDISRVEAAVENLLKEDGNLHLIQGDLLDNSYMDNIAIEINDLLLESGYISLSELCKRFNLPSDFLMDQIEPRVGTIIQGKIDEGSRGSLFTDAFVARQRARILGVFSAMTRPAPITSVLQTYGFHEKLYAGELRSLISDGRLAGKLVGRGDKLEYVPDIQAKTQNRWINAFFRENSYIEFDAVKRLGIRNPKGHLKSVFRDCTVLETCVIGSAIEDLVSATVEEALDAGHFVDVMTLLPSPCTVEDGNTLLGMLPCLKKSFKSGSHSILCNTIVCSTKFIDGCGDVFKELLREKAQTVSQASKKQLLAASREASGGSDAGAAERTNSSRSSAGDTGNDKDKSRKDKRKEKKAKKSGRSVEDRDDSTSSVKSSSGRTENDQWVFLSTTEIQEVLAKSPAHSDCDDDLLAELATVLHRRLHKAFQECVREAFLAGGASADRKKTSDKLDEEYCTLCINARLFQKGVELFSDDKHKASLVRHLLKTVGASMLTVLVRAVAQQQCVPCELGDDVAPQQRASVIKALKNPARVALLKLDALLNEKELDAFLDPLEDFATDHVGFHVKRNDKKRDRQIAFHHRHTLQEQLSAETSPAMVLHLAVVLIFQTYTGELLHAPGKSVPNIVAFLKDHVKENDHRLLVEYQTKVMEALKGAADDESGPTAEEMQSIKALAVAKKAT